MVNNKKKRIFDIIQIGYAGDVASRTFDIAITAAIIINLFIAIFDTFEQSITYQPEAFKNAFSGIWWSVSTLLTVGYGDIYPVTVLGKCSVLSLHFLASEWSLFQQVSYLQVSLSSTALLRSLQITLWRRNLSLSSLL